MRHPLLLVLALALDGDKVQEIGMQIQKDQVKVDLGEVEEVDWGEEEKENGEEELAQGEEEADLGEEEEMVQGNKIQMGNGFEEVEEQDQEGWGEVEVMVGQKGETVLRAVLAKSKKNGDSDRRRMSETARYFLSR
jgi:hypothetical protein